ncbi:MAG: SUMF1/EgtB/PvdO family nonheme iron enzyme [Candidatus Poribacteria bacterium]|nr:SUMF1/EgtB/PvdO family nonheme iron enzyme [Candidatus Poribacteria bacterium]
MKQKDYYATLNVSRDASENEIRKAYRRLALKYHPDKNPGDKTTEAKFREITEAYNLLQDSLERRFYDHHHPPEQGQDLEYNLEMSFEDVNYGKQVTFEVEGRKIKLILNKGDGTYRLRGEGKIGIYGGESGDLLVIVSTIQTPQTILADDGAEMTLIPAGEFLMGSDDEDAYDEEKPVHSVYLDAFYMDKYPVTNAQYQAFVEANSEWSKDHVSDRNGSYLKFWNRNSYPSGRAKHPVVNVSWHAAMAYAEWAGKRLPTEAEWEKAARGGLVGQKYPWGNSIEPKKANYHIGYHIGNADTLQGIVSLLKHASNKANYGKNIGDTTPTTPIGSFPANGYDLYDMAGNVSEWCLDGYDADFYTYSPRKNPILDENRTRIIKNDTFTNCRVLRGGSWCDFDLWTRVSHRCWSEASMMSYYIGFRCAKSVVF